MSCIGIGMVLHKILDKALSSRHNWIKSIEGFAKKKKKKTEIVKHLSQSFHFISYSYRIYSQNVPDSSQ